MLKVDRVFIDVKGINGFSPLEEAVKDDNFEAVETLLEYGASVTEIYRVGNKILHWSLKGRPANPSILRLLIEYGAPVNRSNNFNLSPLHVSAEAGNSDTTAILLEAGASSSDYINAKCDPLRRTAVHLAVAAGSVETVKLLVQHGADVRAPDGNGLHALHIAISNGHLDVMEYLLLKTKGGGRMSANHRSRHACRQRFTSPPVTRTSMP